MSPQSQVCGVRSSECRETYTNHDTSSKECQDGENLRRHAGHAINIRPPKAHANHGASSRTLVSSPINTHTSHEDTKGRAHRRIARRHGRHQRTHPRSSHVGSFLLCMNGPGPSRNAESACRPIRSCKGTPHALSSIWCLGRRLDYECQVTQRRVCLFSCFDVAIRPRVPHPLSGALWVITSCCAWASRSIYCFSHLQRTRDAPIRTRQPGTGIKPRHRHHEDTRIGASPIELL